MPFRSYCWGRNRITNTKPSHITQLYSSLFVWFSLSLHKNPKGSHQVKQMFQLWPAYHRRFIKITPPPLQKNKRQACVITSLAIYNLMKEHRGVRFWNWLNHFLNHLSMNTDLRTEWGGHNDINARNDVHGRLLYARYLSRENTQTRGTSETWQVFEVPRWRTRRRVHLGNLW